MKKRLLLLGCVGIISSILLGYSGTIGKEAVEIGPGPMSIEVSVEIGPGPMPTSNAS